MPTFGDTSSGADEFPCADGRALVDRATLIEAATVTSVWVYCGAGTTAGCNMKGVVLTDSAGPASLALVSSAAAMVASTWVQMAASGGLSAANFWIGAVANNFQGYFGEDATGVSPDICMANGTFSYASPPGTWPGTDANYGVTMNCYVEYTAGAGAATSILLPNRMKQLMPLLSMKGPQALRYRRHRKPQNDDLDTHLWVEHFRERNMLSNVRPT